MSGLRLKWRDGVRRLKREVMTLYLAGRDPRTPWYAKAWTLLVVAYALSPIDLIPDFIPILGYVDDLILLPLGILLAIRLIPPPVLAECRAEAAKITAADRPVSRSAAVVIVLLWIGGALGLIWLLTSD